MYYVYLLKSYKTGNLYTGFTRNLKKRMYYHKLGTTRHTAKNGPYKLIYYEAFLNEADAFNRERFFKSGWGRKHIKKMLKNYFLI